MIPLVLGAWSAMVQGPDLVVAVREVSHPASLIPSIHARGSFAIKSFRVTSSIHDDWDCGLFESSAHPFERHLAFAFDLLLWGSSLLSLSSTHYQQLNT